MNCVNYINSEQQEKPVKCEGVYWLPIVASGYIFEVSSSTMNCVNYINSEKEYTIFLKINKH